MKHLVEEAIEALTALDAVRLDTLLGELAIRQMQPLSFAEAQAMISGQRILGALLLETERNLRLLRRSSLCGLTANAIGAEVYSAAWHTADSGTTSRSGPGPDFGPS